jgi:hypothetical protein
MLADSGIRVHADLVRHAGTNTLAALVAALHIKLSIARCFLE